MTVSQGVSQGAHITNADKSFTLYSIHSFIQQILPEASIKPGTEHSNEK
jgi:hypothetical protein